MFCYTDERIVKIIIIYVIDNWKEKKDFGEHSRSYITTSMAENTCLG